MGIVGAKMRCWKGSEERGHRVKMEARGHRCGQGQRKSKGKGDNQRAGMHAWSAVSSNSSILMIIRSTTVGSKGGLARWAPETHGAAAWMHGVAAWDEACRAA